MNSFSTILILVLALTNCVIGVVMILAKREKSNLQSRFEELTLENEQFVDEIERINQELHIVRIQAGESDRLKLAFLSNMSHELRTPLHAIMGFAGIIANPALPDDQKVAYVQIINRNVDSLLEIVNDIFDISQFEAGNANLIPEDVLVNDLINTLQTAINLEKTHVGKEEITIVTKKAFKDNTFSIRTDAYKLKRALSHLIHNALKYSKDGVIEIGYLLEEKQKVVFYVKDEGVGFNPEHLEQMFAQFRQLDETPVRKYGGLGLGLTLAQKFARILNGRLWADSKPGHGSTFYFSIPTRM